MTLGNQSWAWVLQRASAPSNVGDAPAAYWQAAALVFTLEAAIFAVVISFVGWRYKRKQGDVVGSRIQFAQSVGYTLALLGVTATLVFQTGLESWAPVSIVALVGALFFFAWGAWLLSRPKPASQSGARMATPPTPFTGAVPHGSTRSETVLHRSILLAVVLATALAAWLLGRQSNRSS